MATFEVGLAPVAHVPEIRLHLAGRTVGLWDATGGEYRSDTPPPFWAFAWPGGQAVARYVLDHPESVAGLRVLDLACGSGLVAIAAAKAGAAEVAAVDVDPAATTAVERNASANGVDVAAVLRDILDDRVDADVVLAGDVFYSKALADRMGRFLRRAGQGGARVLVGDPDRSFLPRQLFRPVASYDIPVDLAVEGARSMTTTVFELVHP